ncbi:wee1-like protein kinase [Drosophila persimilis]|uniref:Wee1-like protein kinase n=1 Tax=Drosophila pseudoobscura pseudoobscura TaxID=46245 RepID=Q29JY2_DROPS|nr:wee1-like protein kinase isoform X1 [Drosophila pseudoobscura]XP_026843447.1 wee1-like protein kinase [Drosophila persimilis]
MAFRQSEHEMSVTSLEHLDSSVELRSGTPSPQVFNPRKLRFADDDFDKDQPESLSPQHKKKVAADVSMSPPCQKVRALRLFSTPATPKTILQKSQCSNHLSAAAAVVNASRREELFRLSERPRCLPLHNRSMQPQDTANVNPFTPDSLLAHNKKRCRTQVGRENLNVNAIQKYLLSDTCDDEGPEDVGDPMREIHQAPKRLALHDTNISRFKREFMQVRVIGVGEFGVVFQCVNRLDGCIYAIKKSKKPVAGSSFEKRALNEVWAHAVLGKHDNVVRYYSAWAEDDHMLIQNEFCDGGSLHARIQDHFLGEAELKIVLMHVIEGLRYIHSNDLVHMDLKPENIFSTMNPTAHKLVEAQPQQTKDDDGMDSVYEELRHTDIGDRIYKIGDLGHVTSVKEPHVEEGDCRYLPKELLKDDYSDLVRADIFSLGITLFEVAGGGPLPKNGPDWHKLRNGEVPYLSTLSKDFNELIALMMHPDPDQRPTSQSIFSHPILSAVDSKSKLQLGLELTMERRKNEILMNKLRDAKKTIKQLEAKVNLFAVTNNPESVEGQRCLRSFTRRTRTPFNTHGRYSLGDRNKNVITNV